MDYSVILDQCDAQVSSLIVDYIARLQLPDNDLMVTTSRVTYRSWLGRSIPSAYGGAYCYLKRVGKHAVLINVERIDTDQPRAIELVVAEELIHMRDHIDGDHRRHGHHGYDRIAVRVSDLTGASMEEIRSTLRPVKRRPIKHYYQCPGCGVTVGRRKKGTWSCGRCSPRFDRRFVMRIVEAPDLPGLGTD